MCLHFLRNNQVKHEMSYLIERLIDMVRVIRARYIWERPSILYEEFLKLKKHRLQPAVVIGDSHARFFSGREIRLTRKIGGMFCLQWVQTNDFSYFSWRMH